jgi:hypothetical protein
VRPDQAADLSGLIMTSSLIGQVVGIAAFVGIYLGAVKHGSAHALALTTAALGTMLIVSAAAAARAALSRGSELPGAAQVQDMSAGPAEQQSQCPSPNSATAAPPHAAA